MSPDPAATDPAFAPFVLVDEDEDTNFAVWEGEVDVPGLEEPVLVGLHTRLDVGPTPAHRDALLDFSNHAERYLEAAMRGIFGHLRDEDDRYGGDFPRPETIDQVRSEVSGPSLLILDREDGRCGLAVNFAVFPWDVEHGVSVAFEEGRVVAVGDRGMVEDHFAG